MKTEKPKRKAIFVRQALRSMRYPVVMDESDKEYDLSSRYSSAGLEKDFHPGELVVLEATKRYASDCPRDEDEAKREEYRIWKLVRK